MKSWVNFHNHTLMSMLDGHGSSEAYAERARALGMPGVSVTDHGNIHGWLDHYDACQACGIQPILGIEAYQARKTRFDRDEEERAGRAADEFQQRGPHHLTLIAKNLAGYQNIIKLSSRAYLEGFYVKPRLDEELLADHAEGVIILSGCLSGKIQQAFLRGEDQAAYDQARLYQDIVGKDNFFIEIMNHGIDKELEVFHKLVDLAHNLGTKLIPTGDCHYVHQDDAYSHDVLLCVSTGSTLDQENRFRFHNQEFYLKSYEEMNELFPAEWLKNTLDLASEIDLHLEFGELYFPEYVSQKNEEFEPLVWEGLTRRYGEGYRGEVKMRAEYEMGVIQRMGFEDYFLVVSDIMRWAKEHHIRVGAGRGSAAGSIISYALGITELDPLQFGLLFERFLVEGRKSMPDIDIDIDDAYRDQVIEYVRQRYGEDRVAHIVTFSKIKAKQAIKDSCRVLGFSFADGTIVSKLVPAPLLGKDKSLQDAMETSEMAQSYEENTITKQIMDTAFGIEGKVRQAGVHAAGVVIAPSAITDFLPVMQVPNRDGTPGLLKTQWEMHSVERAGILKIDFLGLRNIRIIDVAIRHIAETHHEAIEIHAIPFDDAATYQELSNGNSVGIFQLESTGMRELMVAMQPSSIEDIMALISLYRPGTLGAGMDKVYVARKHGRTPIRYAHPLLETVLHKTYGIMVYQEDVLNVAKQLAGFTPGEADDLRRDIGKKKIDKIHLHRKRFVEGAKRTNDVPESLGNQIYSDIEYFAGYGFPLAHAASYALLAYQTAYLKTHYTAEYMAALLSTVQDKLERAALYLQECKRLGIKVSPPSVNESTTDFRVLNDHEILFGFSSVTGLGDVATAQLTETHASFTTIYDFFRRSPGDSLNKKTVESLGYAGAFDAILPEQPDVPLRRNYRMMVLNEERSKLGMYITEHPLETIWPSLEDAITHQIIELGDLSDNSIVTVAGIILVSEKRKTKRGQVMYRLLIEDLTGPIEVIVFPRDVEKLEAMLYEGATVIVKARVNQEGDDENTITALRLIDLHIPDLGQINAGMPLYFDLPDDINPSLVKEICQAFETNPGDSRAFLRFHDADHIYTYEYQKPVSEQIHDKIRGLLNMEQLVRGV